MPRGKGFWTFPLPTRGGEKRTDMPELPVPYWNLHVLPSTLYVLLFSGTWYGYPVRREGRGARLSAPSLFSQSSVRYPLLVVVAAGLSASSAPPTAPLPTACTQPSPPSFGPPLAGPSLHLLLPLLRSTPLRCAAPPSPAPLSVGTAETSQGSARGDEAKRIIFSQGKARAAREIDASPAGSPAESPPSPPFLLPACRRSPLGSCVLPPRL